jgi:hypothetical protein
MEMPVSGEEGKPAGPPSRIPVVVRASNGVKITWLVCTDAMAVAMALPAARNEKAEIRPAATAVVFFMGAPLRLVYQIPAHPVPSEGNQGVSLFSMGNSVRLTDTSGAIIYRVNLQLRPNIDPFATVARPTAANELMEPFTIGCR